MSRNRRHPQRTQRPDEVELLVPARAGQGATARAVAVDLAAREDLDVDSIADIRLAVGEACEALVAMAVPNSTLRCWFRAAAGALRITVQVRSTAWVRPRQDSFRWRAMTTLTDFARMSVGPDTDGQGEHLVTVELVKQQRPGEASS